MQRKLLHQLVLSLHCWFCMRQRRVKGVMSSLCSALLWLWQHLKQKNTRSLEKRTHVPGDTESRSSAKLTMQLRVLIRS